MFVNASERKEKPKEKPWNRCNICGRFISMKEFDEGKAVRELVYPDSAFTVETFDTYHVACDS